VLLVLPSSRSLWPPSSWTHANDLVGALELWTTAADSAANKEPLLVRQ
jgi:hypothetical protein